MEDILLKLGELSCRIKLFGATVVSFKDEKENREALFVSKHALLDGSKPIRGGIPIVFPVFGADPHGELASHGFARTSKWQVLTQQSEHKCTLVLDHTMVEWKLHPHVFRLEYEVELISPGSLRTALRVMNFGGLLNHDEFPFQCLLHTYLNLGEEGISKTFVRGFEPSGAAYIDQLKSGQGAQKLQGGALVIDQEVDQIYLGNAVREGEELVVEVDGKPKYLCRRQYHCFAAARETRCDVVVWNPWQDKAKRLADFGDDEYKEMLCIEPGNVSRRDVLKGGEDAVLVQVLTFL